jgi:hypothetical protein
MYFAILLMLLTMFTVSQVCFSGCRSSMLHVSDPLVHYFDNLVLYLSSLAGYYCNLVQHSSIPEKYSERIVQYTNLLNYCLLRPILVF